MQITRSYSCPSPIEEKPTRHHRLIEINKYIQGFVMLGTMLCITGLLVIPFSPVALITVSVMTMALTITMIAIHVFVKCSSSQCVINN